ncbi:MAG: CotH kinase family protein [Fibrobacter sp.]|nr:CotH kinase family protein [Fibrobacter sp.]
MKKIFLIGISFLAVAFLACGDDNSTGNSENNGEVVGPDGKVIPDSILYSDSLYSWYLEQFDKENPESSSSKNPSGSSGSDSTGTSASSSSGIVLDEKLVEASKVHLLPPAGFYSELTIPVPAPLYGGIIRCTFNGSEPDEETEEFTEPYRVMRNTPVRCAEFVDDTIARKSSHTFFIREQVSMPVVAISVDSEFFYTRYGNTSDCFGENPYGCRLPIMEDAEFPVHVEFFENGSASTKKAWQIDAGISLMGNYSRTYAKKPVAIKMKKIYEDGRLKYNLFSTRPEDNKFKGFNLRNSGNRFVGDFVADPAMVSVVEGSGVDYQRSRQVVVFYNGVYMGIHDLRERLNEHFVETNHGIDSKSVDMIKHVKDTVTANGGTVDSYIEMLNFIGANNFNTDTSDEDVAKKAAENYKHAQTLLDVGNYADYMAAEIYLRNGDWPSNNVRAWRTAEQPYRFILFDVDQGFGWEWTALPGIGSMFDWIKNDRSSGRTAPGFFANIFIQLRQNADFCRMFVNHAAVMLTTYLTYDRIVAAVDRVNSEIPQQEMDRDLDNEEVFQRRYSPYGSFPQGFDRTGAYVVSYARTRTASTRNEYREEFGLGEDISVTISATGNGKVLLDGMTLPNSSYTGTFFEGNDMLLTAVPEGSSKFVKWEDGSTENPRLVTPADGDAFTAIFE